MRNFMTSTLGAILILAGIATIADAANFTDTSFGISINVDETLSKQPLVRDIQYFNSKDRSGSLMIKKIHDLSIVDFLGELQDVGYRNSRDAVFLRITGKPIEADIESGRGLLLPVSGQIRGQQIKGVIGTYSGNDGQGFLVIGSAKPEHWTSWKSRMKTMFNSVQFVKVDSEALVKDWKNRLKGKKLQHKTANVADAAPLHLCSDGTVTRMPAVAGQAPGQTMSSMYQRRGMWRVIVLESSPYLIVRDGREQELKLEDEGEKFLLNGRPTIITASDLCK